MPVVPLYAVKLLLAGCLSSGAAEKKWNFDHGADGWVAQNQCRLLVRDGILSVISTGKDPYLSAPVVGSSGWYVVTIRARFRGKRSGQLFWTTDENRSTSEKHSTHFEMRSRSRQWQKHSVYFQTNSPLRSIRLDPHNGAGRTEIDWIEIKPGAPPTDAATAAKSLSIQAGFEVERLYSVPQHTQGSWVSLTVDPQGRLICCDQYGGLYRVTLHDELNVESIPVRIGAAQGMVWAHDSLYVVVNGASAQGPGLYRIIDSNQDDVLDQVNLLQKLETTRVGVEHGPHGVIVGPDRESLYIVAGNMTRLPQATLQPARHQHWAEDLLLKRDPASNGHASNLMAPGGWVCKTDKDGKRWELIAAGFRNPYDIAFDRQGELFTYDADMEMDVGTPWYRPTRVCHVVSGAEFGWRYGTGKWPPYFPDSLPAVVNVGLGSPTGIAFGHETNFPEPYQSALFICDWTYGKMYAVHLSAEGPSYSGTLEPFLSGTPMPLTDLVVRPQDGCLYFTTGGRRTQSGLYRIRYTGPPGDPGSTGNQPADLAMLRRRLEQLHCRPGKDSTDLVWTNLAHPHRHIRFAARVALERLDPKTWIDRYQKSISPDQLIQATIAISRLALTENRGDVLGKLKQLERPNGRQLADWLRALSLVFQRLGEPDEAERKEWAALLRGRFPLQHEPASRELIRLLVFLGDDSAVPEAMRLLSDAGTQEAKLFYAMLLRLAQNGWTDTLRRGYFQYLADAETAAGKGDYSGGGHMQVYIQRMREQALAGLTPKQQREIHDILEAPIVSAIPTGSPTPRKFVRDWTVEALTPSLDEISTGRSYENGKALFRDASCIQCHRFGNAGGILGPDITGASKRLSRRDLLREIMVPSVQVSDQYQTHSIVTFSGRRYEGRILEQANDFLRVAVDPTKPAYVVEIPKADIELAVRSTVSMMPKGLLNTLSRDDILDLLAYIESGGNPEAEFFR